MHTAPSAVNGDQGVPSQAGVKRDVWIKLGLGIEAYFLALRDVQ